MGVFLGNTTLSSVRIRHPCAAEALLDPNDTILRNGESLRKRCVTPTGADHSSSIRERQPASRLRLVSSNCRSVDTVREDSRPRTSVLGPFSLRRADTGFISQTGCVRFRASHTPDHTGTSSDIEEPVPTDVPGPTTIHFAHGVSHPSGPHARPRPTAVGLPAPPRHFTSYTGCIRERMSSNGDLRTLHRSLRTLHRNLRCTRETPAHRRTTSRTPEINYISHTGSPTRTELRTNHRFTSQTGCVRLSRHRPPEPQTGTIDFASGSR